jgi:surface antigen
MHRRIANVLVGMLAVAGLVAPAGPAAADPPWKGGPPHGKSAGFDDADDRRFDSDDGRARKGKHARSAWRDEGDGDARRHKYWHKSKKHKYRAAVYKRGGGPPPWAPAWGYRRKQAEYAWYDEPASYPSPYPGYDARSYFPPFGIGAGRCDRASLGNTVGDAAGTASGNFLKTHGADGDVASFAGLVIGAVVSDKVARRMDRLDQACIGQILEHAPDGRNIVWSHAGGPHYDVVPLATYLTGGGTYCREYQTTTFIAGQVYRERGLACRQPNGALMVAG